MQDLFATLMDGNGVSEELHPDLVPHLAEGNLGPMIHHPLVISILHSDAKNGFVNRQYDAKKAQAEAAFAARQWARYVFLHERPYRIDALKAAVVEGFDTPALYWELVAQVWTDSENINECIGDWIELWDADLPDGAAAMNEDDHAALLAMPDEITVYRGVGHADAVAGMSWTTDRAAATWFAKRFQVHSRTPIVATATVKRSDVIAYLTGRNESEIVVLPQSVHIRDIAPA